MWPQNPCIDYLVESHASFPPRLATQSRWARAALGTRADGGVDSQLSRRRPCLTRHPLRHVFHIARWGSSLGSNHIHLRYTDQPRTEPALGSTSPTLSRSGHEPPLSQRRPVATQRTRLPSCRRGISRLGWNSLPTREVDRPLLGSHAPASATLCVLDSPEAAKAAGSLKRNDATRLSVSDRVLHLRGTRAVADNPVENSTTGHIRRVRSPQPLRHRPESPAHATRSDRHSH
jgi:hypothetical protein